MTDINSIIESLLAEQHSVEMAESDFRRMLVDDADMRRDYKLWCRERGDSDKTGFINYAHELIDEQEAHWDTLTDPDDEY